MPAARETRIQAAPQTPRFIALMQIPHRVLCREVLNLGSRPVALEELKRLNESIFVTKPLQLPRRAHRT